MRLTALPFICLILPAFLIISCKKEVAHFQTETISDYMPLQPGKYLIYQVDSTVFTNFGRTEEVHSYQEKDVVDTLITDNLNRPSYRVYRYLRDSAGTGNWQPISTYFITPVANGVEVIDDNLRTLNLIVPIQQGTTWKGNRYLPTEPYSDQYSFNNDDNMSDWNYTMDSTNETLSLNGQTYDNVVKITAEDETINFPITDPQSYASQSYAVEKYAKGIGLIYKELILWEYQPNIGGASPYQTGFGIKRTLLDHN